jgi:hypothetical protein
MTFASSSPPSPSSQSVSNRDFPQIAGRGPYRAASDGTDSRATAVRLTTISVTMQRSNRRLARSPADPLDARSGPFGRVCFACCRPTFVTKGPCHCVAPQRKTFGLTEI